MCYTLAMPTMSADDLHRFVEEHFPQARDFCQVSQLSDETIELHLPYEAAGEA